MMTGKDKRIADRGNNEQAIDALFNVMREKFDEVEKNLAPLKDIVDSLPRDEQGKPSPFIHRVQHEEQTKNYKTKNRFLDSMKGETGRLLTIVLVVVLANILTSPIATAIAKAIEKALL